MNTAEYLVQKLEELGINDFFGVAGDYNSNIVSAINDQPNTNWVACTNELNAGYAADGYARERGYGALITTYGVGELNAINAIAGSFAENVSVINIVGVPDSKIISNKICVHHNFQDVQPFAYAEAFKNVVETTAFLNRDNAKIEIDRVLKTLVKERKPVYIAIPTDIARMEVSDKSVEYQWESDKEALNKVVGIISDKIRKSKNPVILGDVLIKRFDAKDVYEKFVEKTGLPTINFLMGTNILDAKLKNNLGTYFSELANPIAKDYLEKTDCLISVGVIYSDFNSFGLDLPFKINSQIAIYGTYVYIEGIRYDGIKMSDVLSELAEIIDARDCTIEKSDFFYEKNYSTENKLDSEYIYPRLQEFIKEDDILVSDTEIISLGVARMEFPKNSELVTQALWSSSGWATPATLGTVMASPKKRVILFTRESSFQVSALEFGNLLRYGVKPVVIVLNNKGYSKEKLPSEKTNSRFNEVLHINYSKFARIFDGDVWSTRVETRDDFDKALKVTQIMNKLCFIEVCTESDDMPKLARDLMFNLQKKQKVDSTLESESIDYVKFDSKIPKKLFNFATKVHESLK